MIRSEFIHAWHAAAFRVEDGWAETWASRQQGSIPFIIWEANYLNDTDADAGDGLWNCQMDFRGANRLSANHFKATWMYTDMDMVNIDMVHMDMVHMYKLYMVDMSKVDMGMTDM